MSEKPRVEVIPRDGNAFSILGGFRKAADRAGWEMSEIDAVVDEAKSGDYEHLIQTIMEHADLHTA